MHLVAGIALLAFAALIALCNGSIVIACALHGRSSSMLCLVGGLASALAVLLLHLAPRWLLILPMLDPGVSCFVVLGPIELVRRWRTRAPEPIPPP